MFVEVSYALAFFVVFQLQAAPQPDESQVLRGALHAYDWEPSVRQTQDASIAFAGLGPERVAGMRPRARWRALVPDVVEGRYQLDEGKSDRFNTSEDLDTELRVLDTATSTSRSEDVGGRWYLSAKWDLRGLVFDPRELDVEKLANQMAEDRIDLETLVGKVYFARRRLQVDLLLSPPTNALDAAPLYLDLRELTAQLDALTGGWFGEELRRRRRR
jgi:hypothetical protein